MEAARVATTSILDDLGHEVTGIVAPVSICMFLTVVLVRLLNPEGVSNPSAVAIAQTYYREQAGDSAGTKLEGALLNALIFVVIVGAMTFVLFLLFKYGCEKCIYGYMGFAGFSIFFLLTGVVAIQLIQLQPVPLDAVSFTFILWNFSVVGTVTLFVWPAPLLMKQGYLVVTGTIVAFVFTGIPEWTTWFLLVAMALYDVVAVLTPNGPLKLLVELAIERDTDIPALVYEARPTVPGSSRWQRQRQQQQQQQQQQQHGGTASSALPSASPAALGTDAVELTDQSSRSSNSPDTSPTADDGVEEQAPLLQAVAAEDIRSGPNAAQGAVPQEQTTVVGTGGLGFVEGIQNRPSRQSAAGVGPNSEIPRRAREDAEDDSESAPLVSRSEPSSSQAPRTSHERQRAAPAVQDGADQDFGLPDAIKLGMGDFIFYSVLVGRAAMYDLLTVFASYLAIIAGLGATLILLALFQKALPALPISIALGVSFYFLARTILEPFVLPLSVHLLYF